MTSRPRTAATLLALAVLAGACSADRADPRAADPPAATSGSSTAAASSSPAGGPTSPVRYVALGDSYSAGPLIPTSDLAGGCLRSDHDYPSLVARRLRVDDFVDVTCSGAQTADLTTAQRPFPGSRVPPQLRAVTPGTDLVTVGIGGNDLDLFATVIGTCTRLRASDPTGSPCARELTRRGFGLRGVTATIARRVTVALRMVRAKAPHARVLLVGYPRLVPDHGTCRRLPLADGDYAVGRRVSRALDRALRAAARRAGVDYVDTYAASRGHDVCSAHPWVNGGTTDRRRALAYHPLLSGMRADAARVVAALRRD